MTFTVRPLEYFYVANVRQLEYFSFAFYRAGMLKIQDTSKQFGGDNAAIEDQIAACDKELQRLRSLLHQYQVFVESFQLQ